MIDHTDDYYLSIGSSGEGELRSRLALGGFHLGGIAAGQRVAVEGDFSSAPTKSKAFRVFIISVVLLALDVTWFMTEEYVLGLHHHGGEVHGYEEHTH
ncbi:MAG: hypothetical protein EBQ80_06590 [Proteobacteria bacterium]|nr:hypothetical protein [Bacteroidota bacterium]NBX86877.1 hypothetical protein [Pseudomonadota bacterium]